MSAFAMPDWAAVFAPDGSLLESFLRGTCVYFGVLVLFRAVLKRQLGSLGLGDVLLLVLVSEAVSPALSAEMQSLPNGLAAMAALLVWNYAMDWAAYRWPRFRRLLHPEPLPLVRDGRPVRENLECERITMDELLGQLRLNGIEDASQVRAAYIEGEGQVSVIPRDDEKETDDEPDSAKEFDLALEQFLNAARRLRRFGQSSGPAVG